ncbi:hypothetical protein KI387_021338, partial [Taxus chinensis]
MKPFVADEAEPKRSQPNRPAANVIDIPDKELDKILEMKTDGWGNRRVRKFFVTWVGCYSATWEREQALWRYKDK